MFGQSGLPCCNTNNGLVTIVLLIFSGNQMVKPDPKIFEDLTRVAGGAMNLFSGIREQILNDAKARFEEMASRMDLVPREDFDRLELQVRDLQKRLDAVQGKAPAKKPASKPAAAKAKTTKKPKKKS